MDIKSFNERQTDISEIPYNEESTQWAVYYDHGFWNKNAKGKSGKGTAVNKSFMWGDEIWHIPAVYSCSKGLVVDFCVEIEPSKEKYFIDKWYPVLAKDENISNELREQIEQENPIDINFKTHLQVNGKNEKQHCALSALRFDHADDIEWKIVFREKTIEDIEVDLF